MRKDKRTQAPDANRKATLDAAAIGTQVAGWGFLLGFMTFAHAADMDYCHRYASGLTQVLRSAVADLDIEQYAADRAYSTCLNRDESPQLPFVPGVTEAPQGTVPATDGPAWIERCKKKYRTFDEATGTVIRRNHHGVRARCPL